MRKHVFIVGLALSASAVFAQSAIKSPQNQVIQKTSATYNRTPMKGDEILGNILIKPNPYVNQKNLAFAEGFQIGTTMYDLQTNGSNRNAIYAYSDGSVASVFTFGNNPPGYADRGTGYNYMDAAQNWGTFGGTREEATTRTGWPSIAYANNSEWVISHEGVTNGAHVLSRNTKGTGNWTIDADIPLMGLWPRIAADGNNIHVITTGNPDDNPVSGLNGPIYYHRSTDGGATWDISNAILPELDASSNYGWGGDCYSIDVKGNTVAILVVDDYNPTFVLKSTDNGDTWTKMIINDPGLGIYGPGEAGSISDINSDGVADTIHTTDQSGWVLIDNSGNVHAWFGLMRVLDTDPAADAASSFFPVTDGIGYWRENNPGVVDTLGGVQDTDGSGFVLDNLTSIDNIATYYQSLSSWPTAGIDASGTIYLAYSTVMEELNDGNDPFQFYRHIYIVKSSDGGATWSAPYHIPTQFQYGEYIFPTMARNVTDVIHLTCQKDASPGLSVRGDEDPADVNEILYFQIPVTLPADLSVETVEVNNSFVKVFPNPASTIINVNVESSFVGESNIKIIDITGKVVASENVNLTNGENVKSFDISSFKPGVYAINVMVDGKVQVNKFVKH